MPLPEDKDHEIPAFQDFISSLNLKDGVVTTDAFTLQKKTFECAEAVGAIFITQAKDNQEDLREQLEHGCKMQQAIKRCN